MVGEEAPHELMRDGGEPPIHGGLRPDHRREFVPHTTSLEKKRQVKGVEGGCEGDRRKKIGRTLEQNIE
jgi:hypothetical protein